MSGGYTCTCGHVIEEHAGSTLMPCEAEGCDCIAYERDDDE